MHTSRITTLPIERYKNEILSALEKVDFLIIKSTPGSGKTTLVPLFLSEKYQKKIYILEPRKLAAKLAAQYVAKLKNESIGKSIGYIFKYEHMAQRNTQIVYVTEGSFLRVLEANPTLDDTDVVILDEFHERHYHTDVAFSFLLKLKDKLPKLKIIIMSATIDLKELENLLGKKSLTIEVNESKHSLEIRYLENNTLVLKDSLEKKVYNALSDVVMHAGHVLVFLPGMWEIKKCAEMINRNFPEIEVVILHGELAGINIDEGFYNLTNKKIILSTNIAESSVTIPGVRIVIDSGLHKTSRMSPLTRFPLVEEKKISQSSAIQRANRASREAPGFAIRLFSLLDFQSRPRFDLPEINRSDLSELVMMTFNLFNHFPSDLTFLSPVNEAELNEAQSYLQKIGFIENLTLTNLGKKLARTPFSPRIARVLFSASQCEENSFREAIQFIAELVEPKFPERFKSLVTKFFKPSSASGGSIDLEKIILSGFVDQVAKLKDHTKVIHQSGVEYQISPSLARLLDHNEKLWIVLEIDNKNQVSKMLPIEEEWLYDLSFLPIEEKETFDFDIDKNKLFIERVLHIGAIVLSKEKFTPTQITLTMVEIVSKKILNHFNELKKSNHFYRLQFLEKHTVNKIADFNFTEWMNQQVSLLLENSSYLIDQIFENFIEDMFHFLNSEGMYNLKIDLPLQIALHDKKIIDLHYDTVNGISCESHIQNFYGMTKLPTLLQGRERLTIHLLGPHKRAVQVTQNLAHFWDKTYHQLLPELKRDYPRHYWPDNPQNAKPVLTLKKLSEA